jgi:hydrogenase-4 component F
MVMMWLLLTPLVASALCWIVPRRRWLAWLESVTLASGALSLALAGLAAWRLRSQGHLEALGGWLYADALSGITVLIIAFVGFTAALYSIGYLREDLRAGDLGPDEARSRLRIYYTLLNLFLFSMLVVPVTNSLGVLWIAIEGTTLASLFLVSFYGTREALEAAWKYIIVGSVGIALGLFGTILTYYSAVRVLGTSYDLNWSLLVPIASQLDPDVMRLALLFIVIGYGTKAGLAPMHTWLPDAHSEAPSPISALLSGVLLNCAMYAVLRFYALATPSLGRGYPDALLLGFGLLSLFVATAFILKQRDYKRLLAYSSVEHMGLVAVGVAFGGPLGLAGALLQLINHAATKSLMFFASGHVLLRYGTKEIAAVPGIVRVLPVSGAMLVLGGLALSGAPPFSLFASELTIFAAGFQNGHALAATVALALVALVFAGLLGSLNRMVFGTAPIGIAAGEPSWTGQIAMGVSLAVVVGLGLVVPAPLAELVRQAAAVLAGDVR